jgi:hypothetical protein
MRFDYELAFQQVKKFLGRHQDTLEQEIEFEKDLNKRLSLYSEIFFASALQKCIGKDGALIEQKGENHPDVIMKMNGVRFNFEVTLMTQDDERFGYESIKAEEYAVNDKPKLQLTSKIYDKTKQYERWFNKGIVNKNDVNIIAVDLGNIFPMSFSGTLLDSAIFMMGDEYEIHIDSYGSKCDLPMSRGFLVKKDCDGREFKIHLGHLYEGLKHIDALITFTKHNILERNNTFDFININNNGKIERIISLMSRHYETTVSRWEILRKNI